jgi:hypothetical protein
MLFPSALPAQLQLWQVDPKPVNVVMLLVTSSPDCVVTLTVAPFGHRLCICWAVRPILKLAVPPFGVPDDTPSNSPLLLTLPLLSWLERMTTKPD